MEGGEAGTCGGCGACGLVHAPGELFVTVGIDARGSPVVVDTCELEPARERAHAELLPPGSVAYHGTYHPDAVLEHGLDPAEANSDCKHVCLAETPEIAAGAITAGVVDLSVVVLEVDVSGLDLFFELGEARHHGSAISPARIRVLGVQPAPIRLGWSDPAWRRNHSDCLALHGLPLSRRLLNAAEEEVRRRYPYGNDRDQFRAVVAELVAGRSASTSW